MLDDLYTSVLTAYINQSQRSFNHILTHSFTGHFVSDKSTSGALLDIGWALG